MPVYPIRTFGDPVLRLEAASVPEIDDAIRRLVEGMIETMYAAPGVGLAAPQVGVSKAIFVFDAQDERGARVLINPELIESSGELEFEEGCLSVPGHFWPIIRPDFSRIRGIDLEGQPVEYSGTGLMGRVLQHEFDHLQGKLLIERLDRRRRKQALRDLRDEALGLRHTG
ncbi:MAG TPA: peptide deformylase [Acidimicrobiia bacterium]|nr:peptide deformylase [Acidimicrobiia bacterium]